MSSQHHHLTRRERRLQRRKQQMKGGANPLVTRETSISLKNSKEIVKVSGESHEEILSPHVPTLHEGADITDERVIQQQLQRRALTSVVASVFVIGIIVALASYNRQTHIMDNLVTETERLLQIEF